MKKTLLLTFMAINLMLNAQTIRFVKQGGTGNGSSWTDASEDLQAVINLSVEGDQIWVAAGTYLPTRRANNLTIASPNHRDNAFVLKKNVNLYGGFIGNETTLSQRDWIKNEVVLSGDFLNDDFLNSSGTGLNNENAHHVIICAGDAGSTRIDVSVYVVEMPTENLS